LIDELEKLQKQTVLDLYKEQFKRVLDGHYSNQANTDKLIITILFAEIGFLTHYITVIKNIHIWYGIPILIGIIGITIALTSYNFSKKLLSYEESRLELKITQFVILKQPDEENEEAKNTESVFLELSDKTGALIRQLNFWMYLFLALTTLSSIITIYIIKIYY